MQQKVQQTLIKNVAKSDKMQIESTTKPKAFLPWVEKYRPHKIEDISHQDEVTKSMQGVLITGNLPHLLFYGPPGTGKTSSILAISRQLFGVDFYKKRILELNASDDRGIGVVREKVKKFAETAVTKNPDSKFLCPGFRIIILDEADLMTHDAQSALRRIIEDNSSTTRFCIICNYITKIIEPLSSRCVKFRFKPISLESQIERLKYICELEGVKYDLEALRTLIEVCEGDLRKSINLLQSASLLFDKTIDNQSIIDISGIVPSKEIDNVFDKIKEGDINNLMKAVDNLLLEGYSPDQIINQYLEQVLGNVYLTEIKKARILEKIAECEQALNEGGKDDLQLYNLFSSSLWIMTKPDY